MPDYTITYEGVPFRINAPEGMSRQAAEAGLIESFQDENFYKDKLANRKAQLLEMGIDIDRDYSTEVTEDMSGLDRFLVGAGRTFTETTRGVQQTWHEARGNKERVRQLQKEEANARETFDLLDSEGLGWEDLGQLAPELVAFIGTGGQSSLLNLGVRGAALGASKATVEGEDRNLNAIMSGVFAAGGGAALGALRGLGSMFSRGAKFVGSAAAGLGRLAGRSKSPGQLADNVSSAMTQAQQLANSKDALLRRTGQEALDVLRPVIQGMNATGKESLFRTQLTQLFQSSIRQVDNTLSLDMGAFVRGLETVGKGELVKQAGRTYGTRVDTIRNVFTEMGKYADDIPPETARATLKAVLSSDSAAAVARQVSKLVNRGARPEQIRGHLDLLFRTVQRGAVPAAAAGEGSTGADVVEEVRAGIDRVVSRHRASF